MGRASCSRTSGGAHTAPRDLRSLDLLFWPYAKIIADSAGVGKRQWAFIMECFKKLQSGEIAWDSIREYAKERNDVQRCLTCGHQDRPGEIPGYAPSVGPFGPPRAIPKYPQTLLSLVHASERRRREEYRERALILSARRLRGAPPGVTLDMTADLIESMGSLRDAGEEALVRRRR
jgi:hypothetical protein